MCDTKNRDKMLRICQQQRVQIEELVEEFVAGGIETKADLATSSSLLDQNKNLSNKQQELELVKERHMVQIRTLLNKERSLAKALGEETLGVDETKIPRIATVRRLELKVEELGLLPLFKNLA